MDGGIIRYLRVLIGQLGKTQEGLRQVLNIPAKKIVLICLRKQICRLEAVCVSTLRHWRPPWAFFSNAPQVIKARLSRKRMMCRKVPTLAPQKELLLTRGERGVLVVIARKAN